MAVYRALEAEVLAQRPAFVFLAKQVAALQLGGDHLHEILAPAWKVGRSDIEAIAGIVLEPVLHDVGDLRRCSNQTETAHAGHFLVQLPDGRLLPFDTFEQLRADAAQLPRLEFVERNGPVERVS